MGKVGKAVGLLALAATGFGLAAAGIGVAGFSLGGVASSLSVSGILARLALSAGLSQLSLALAKKPRAPGIITQETQAGGSAPQSFIIGRYATGGQLMAPRMSHGKAKKTPNAYLTYVMAVSDVPGATLSRIFIDGAVGTVGGTVHPDYGTPITLKGKTDRAWIKWLDGAQTVADPMLLAKYGALPDRPWLADMVGVGLTQAILTFRLDRTLFSAFPSVRFELDGIPLYDPRLDSTVGGVGPHRLGNPATWSQTDNAAVMIYNIALGIPIPGGDVWGGGWQQADLPLASWTAAMNVCDIPEPLAAGGVEPRYRAGLEITVDTEPADAIAEIGKTCNARIADIGGKLKIIVGAPPTAVFALTDGDIIATNEQSADLFPGLNETHNAVQATFPDPEALWEPRDAPPRFDLVAEAADGRRLVGDVSLPACPYPKQVQRLMDAWLKDERRFRRHTVALPPDYAALEPLDVVQWTSVRNGYSAKLFEVIETTTEPGSMITVASLREVDPTDYDWNSTLELPVISPPTGSTLPADQTVPDFVVTGVAITDAGSTARRPALRMTWDGLEQDDVDALEWEVRRFGDTQVLTGVFTDVARGAATIAAGILPMTTYEVRARFVARHRATSWTAWLQATTPDARLQWADIAASINAEVTGAQNSADAAGADAVAALAKANAVEATSTSALVLRLIGGPGGAKILIVDWADETGAGSAIVLSGDDVIAPGTLSTSRLVVTEFGLNLIGNGSFAEGDLRGWITPPTTFSVVAKNPGATATAVINAPTAFILQAASNPANLGSIIASGVTSAGETFAYGLDYAKALSGDGTWKLSMVWRDVAGIQISANSLIQIAASNIWATATAIGTAPAGAVRYDVLLQRLAGGTATIFATRLHAIKQAKGTTLLTPNSVTATEAFFTDLASLNLQVVTADIVDLSVSTLKIAGNAVTIPTAAYTEGAVAISGFVDTVVQSVTFTREGFPTQVQFGFAAFKPGSVSNPIDVKLFRNGVNIFEFRGNFQNNVTDTRFFAFVDSNLGTGATTYEMKLNATSFDISKRFLLTNHVKR